MPAAQPQPSSSSSLEAALSQAETRYRSLFDHALDGIFQTSPDGQYLCVNPALARIYGYESPDALMAAQPNANQQLYVDPGRRAEFVALMDQYGALSSFESQVYRRDGSTIWISESCRVVRDPEGQVLYYEGFVRDITDRKHVEVALRQSEIRNQAILTAIPDLIIRINRAGVYLDYIPAKTFSSLLTREDAIGRHMSEFLPVDLVQQRMQCIERTLATGQPQIDQHQLWIDGKLYDFEGRFVVSGEDEVLLIIRDISDLKRTEEALRQAKDAAEAASQAKSTFLANMSHELRTPLNGILGYTQILLRDPSLTTKQQDGIRIIHRSGSHLLTLINDILDLSKIEAQKVELTPHDFHFANFLSDLVHLFEVRADQKGIAFTYEAEGLPDSIYADEKRLRQVLFNLLGNAVKFTNRGGVTFRVSGVKSQGVGKEDAEVGKSTPSLYKLMFHIEDTGVGIATDQLERIFLPFEQVGDNSRQMEGTGLGLTITQKLVALMDSELHVESQAGEGSQFWFEVALSGANVPSPNQFNPSSHLIMGYSGTRRTILVIDDREDNRSVLVNLLEPLGFQVIEATNGQEGLASATRSRNPTADNIPAPDLIIADLVMPVMDGFEMIRQLRSLPALATMPIIACSASVLEFDRHRSQEAGYNDFLSKPVQAEELLDKLQTHLHLEWIYQTQDHAVAQPAPDAIANLPIPPSEELVALQDAIQIGHFGRVIQEANRIKALDSSYEAFANRLLQLTEEFDDEAIQHLIEPHVNQV